MYTNSPIFIPKHVELVYKKVVLESHTHDAFHAIMRELYTFHKEYSNIAPKRKRILFYNIPTNTGYVYTRNREITAICTVESKAKDISYESFVNNMVSNIIGYRELNYNTTSILKLLNTISESTIFFYGDTAENIKKWDLKVSQTLRLDSSIDSIYFTDKYESALRDKIFDTHKILHESILNEIPYLDEIYEANDYILPIELFKSGEFCYTVIGDPMDLARIAR